jgi:phenylacetate-CoA ligase
MLKYAFRHAMKRNPLVPRRCADLMSRERADPVVHLARQRSLVTQLLAEVCNVPAYECRAALPSDWDPLDYLREAFPIIDKAEVLQRPSSFLRKGRVPPHRLMVAETSGTTGTPFDVYRSFDSMVMEESFHLQHWHWAGWRPGVKQAVLRGDKWYRSGAANRPIGSRTRPAASWCCRPGTWIATARCCSSANCSVSARPSCVPTHRRRTISPPSPKRPACACIWTR